MHKERRDFVLRQNRGVRKICRRKKMKVSRPYYFLRAERVIGAWAHREFEGFGSGCGQRHQSLCECAVGIRWSCSFANAQATSSIAVAFVERHRRRVPLFIDVRPWAEHRGMTVGINESRFATRAWACGERVRYPTIFPKSLIRYLMNEG